MPVTLDQIVAATRRRLAVRHAAADLPALERQALDHRPRGFRRALAERATTAPAIISELKKASPSKGVLRASLDVAALAPQLEAAGATALSVLTEEDYFLGSLSNLRLASASCQLPCLCKDFIVTELQLLEARAHGADCVLLLASVLSDAELRRLLVRARELELDALCEAHDETELERALAAGADLIGVNSRDLRTFHVDLSTPLRLAERLPASVVRIAESGIHSAADLARLRAAGYQAFLIGESIISSADPGQALRQLLADAVG
jgi:indole-3-glycerol phosphate synthase